MICRGKAFLLPAHIRISWNTSVLEDRLLKYKFEKRTEVECPELRPRRRAGHHRGAGRGTATSSTFDCEIELESDNIFSPVSPRALKNKRCIETALVTMERMARRCGDLATRAGASEKGWAEW
jgi:hypothetical protein